MEAPVGVPTTLDLIERVLFAFQFENVFGVVGRRGGDGENLCTSFDRLASNMALRYSFQSPSDQLALLFGALHGTHHCRQFYRDGFQVPDFVIISILGLDAC